MSTIEKAMQRLKGEAATGGVAETPDSGVSETHAGTAPRPGPEDRGGEGLDRSSSFSEIPAPQALSQPASVEGLEQPAEDRSTRGSQRNSGTPSKRSLNIDFARLRQMGFLAPGDPTTRMAEEFQEIKRKLIANAQPGAGISHAPANLIMVTSSVPGEGKTFTSMNLALSLALEIDRTVLAVDIDILKSDLSRLFGAYNRTGLYDYLAHPELDLADIIMRTNVPSLAFIPAGTIREGITERLASQAMFNLTRELAERYPDRLIIFDAPPVLATSGAAALAPLVGQVVLVVEAYNTTQENLRAALGALDHVPIAGIVLNKIRHRAVGRAYGANYGYGYGYGYGATDPVKPVAR